MRRLIVQVLAGIVCATAALGQLTRPSEFHSTDPLNNPATFARDWDTDFGWQITGSSLTARSSTKQFAILQASPWGQRVSVDAVVTMKEPLGTDWKLAGVSIHRDATHYWALGLCETPDSKGKAHVVDIGEMRETVWPANWEDHLPRLQTQRLPEFHWEYNHPYRLRLEMTPEYVKGSVEELNGLLRWRTGFALKGPAVTDGRIALVDQSSHAEFRDLTASVTALVPSRTAAGTYPPYTGRSYERVHGIATGFLHTQKIDDTWWLIDPVGKATLFIATDHVNYNVHWCQALGYAPYHRNVERKYGSEAAWAKSATDRLLSWGFSGVGANGGELTQHCGLAHTAFLNLGAEFCDLGPEYRITFPADGHPVPCSYFPNVFHPRFAEFCQKRAKRLCSASVQDPWLMGYFLDNELAWWGKTWGDTAGLFDECMRKPADHTAKQAVVDWLRTQYPQPADLAKAWGTSITSYDDLLRQTQLTGTREQAARDKRAFAELIADRYFATTTAAVRAVDPNHMILGCRFAGLTNKSYDNAWAAAGKYCDVVTVNVYEKVDLQTGEVYTTDVGKRTPLAEVLKDTNAKVGGKPMMVTEWSYLAYDSGLPNTAGAGQRVNTQAQRALCFDAFEKLLFTTPFMVGSSFFMWADEPAQGIAPWFPEDGNYGLVNVNDEPYLPLVQTATRLHAAAFDLHAGRTAEFKVLQGDRQGTFAIENQGQVAGDCTVLLRDNGTMTQTGLSLAPGSRQQVDLVKTLGQPGSHLLVCEVQPAQGVAERNTQDNTARTIVVTPGISVSTSTSLTRQLLVTVANPTATSVPAGPVVLKATDLPRDPEWLDANHLVAFDLGAQTQQPLKVQLDGFADGPELSIALPEIPAFKSKLVLLGLASQSQPPQSAAVPIVTHDKALDITNGHLKLTRTGQTAAILDRLDLDDVEMGKLTAVVHQLLPANAWVSASTVEKLQTYVGPVRTVLDMTLSSSGDNAWRGQWRLCVYPGTPYITARPIWIENAGRRPWKLASYFHYATSNLAGQSAKDKPRGYVWRNADAQLAYGILDLTGQFTGNYWREADTGVEHPDCFRPVNVDLSPGQRFAEPQPEAYVVALKGDYTQASQSLEDSLRARKQLMVTVDAVPPIGHSGK